MTTTKTIAVAAHGAFERRYIELLAASVPNLTLLTDDDSLSEYCETRPLRHNYPHWWCKMEMFAPWNQDLRPAVYFDLDTFITGDVSELYKLDNQKMWLIRDLYHPEISATGVMVLPEDTSKIWKYWSANPEHHQQTCWGDQVYLEKFGHRLIQDHFAGLVSYKADMDSGRNLPTEQTKVVCFHGKPKPHELTEANGWWYDFWTGKRRSQKPA